MWVAKDEKEKKERSMVDTLLSSSCTSKGRKTDIKEVDVHSGSSSKKGGSKKWK